MNEPKSNLLKLKYNAEFDVFAIYKKMFERMLPTYPFLVFKFLMSNKHKWKLKKKNLKSIAQIQYYQFRYKGEKSKFQG